MSLCKDSLYATPSHTKDRLPTMLRPANSPESPAKECDRSHVICKCIAIILVDRTALYETQSFARVSLLCAPFDNMNANIPLLDPFRMPRNNVTVGGNVCFAQCQHCVLCLVQCGQPQPMVQCHIQYPWETDNKSQKAHDDMLQQVCVTCTCY